MVRLLHTGGKHAESMREIVFISGVPCCIFRTTYHRIAWVIRVIICWGAVVGAKVSVVVF